MTSDNENETKEPLAVGSELSARLGEMTIDEHIEQAKYWGSKLPYYPGMTGWRTTCRALAEEVERLREEAKAIDSQHARVIAVWKREENDWIKENRRYGDALERIIDLVADTDTLGDAVSIAAQALW